MSQTFSKKIIYYTTLSFLAAKDEFQDDIREMGKLDENILYDALKHEKIQDHVDLEDDDKEFLDSMSKGNS